MGRGIGEGEAITKHAPTYALITGASSGIGEAFAQLAAAKGVNVGLCARRVDRLEALAKKLRDQHGIVADVFVADLALPGAGLALAKQVRDSGRTPDMLVNNAGFSVAQCFMATDYETQRGFIELTITTPVALTHALLPPMLEQGFGRIINISSITALTSGGKGHTLYPGGKAFLLKFSQSLAAEITADGVYVSAILPGMVRTEFQSANGTADKMQAAPMQLAQSAMQIATESWDRNAKGVEVIVPGFAPKCAAAAFRYVPERIMQFFTRRAAEKYYVGD